jgi:hypothetical protein
MRVATRRKLSAVQNAARYSTTADHWCTPPAVLDPLYEFNGGRPFALDPCSNGHSIVRAQTAWRGPAAGGVDGLAMPWPRPGPVFVNPPFSAKAVWMRKIANEATRGVEVAALLPADVDTGWFHTWGVRANAILFWRGRLTFIGDRDMPARFPCALFYFGRRGRRFSDRLGPFGWVVSPLRSRALSIG